VNFFFGGFRSTLKAKIHFHQNSKGRRGKSRNTHTGSKIGFPWFSKSETIETTWNWSRDCLRPKRDNLMRDCRLQDRGIMRGRKESWQHVVTHRRGGIEARLGVGFESMMCSWVTKWGSQQGLVGSVSMAGGREGQGARKENRVRGHRYHRRHVLFRICSSISAFCLDKEDC